MVVMRELEVGGVYNIGEYENVRIAVRVSCEGGAGKALREAMSLLGMLAEVTVTMRLAYRKLNSLNRMAAEYAERAKEAREDAERERERARELAREKLQAIVEHLDPQVRKALEEQPEVAFEMGLLDSSCIRLGYKEREEDARRYEELAREATEEAEELKSGMREVMELLEKERLEIALHRARDLREKHSITSVPVLYIG